MKALAAFLLALAAAAGYAPQPTPPIPLPRDSVYQLPVELTDQDGIQQSWSTRRGRPQLVSMFYTSCPYVCPLIVESAKAVQHQLSPRERARLDILLISMDPAHDTPEVLKAVATKRRLDPARWTLARPEMGEVRAVAGVLGIRYRTLANGQFNHASVLVLLDADGRILARTERIGPAPDPDFVAEVRRAVTP